jgi:glycosyltransferase involved in cell wall biosynthesis
MTRVSIGLPVFNGARYLASTLESLLAQTHENLEVVVVDNGSSDATADVAEAAAAKDPRIRLVRSPTNLGAIANFNRAIAETTGEFVMWAADHDLYRPTYVERCLEPLVGSPNVVLSYSAAHWIDQEDVDGGLIPSVIDTRGLDQRARMAVTLYGAGPYSYAVYGVMRRSALSRVRRFPRVYPSTVAPDLALLVELALIGEFAYCSEALFTQRRMPDFGDWEATLQRLGIRPNDMREARSFYVQLLRELFGAVHHHVPGRAARLAADVLLAEAMVTTYRWIPRTLRERTRLALERTGRA